ncbi:HEAT repeat-containing protein 3-like isoform X2 [Amphibalanus amphitrite]|uniref:HEAT repeat-containing protein 3-like isoform X1 n=1 Tax=Amphibalanus amphitrite TaxID=1232801 RepID=UPI001C909027|nr:HEAT repeat-containing protein 3-like isoform X1 [Amphibalanus amphitrite]XP_043191978.1 HEAT repeat-containing protein 3-like isoform X1 [Amphibalanus amphitrite]XP_043191979.1 HEAT repeat-containing protein 3-like isoform X2 [Amphibalanus amphitrite]
MGKTRTKRARAARADPTGRQETGDGADGEGGGDAPRGDSIANIVDQLKSAASEERLSGCVTFSQLVSRRLTVDVLRQHRLVRLVGPLLVDPCVDVRQAAAGALRNLSLTGDKEGCDLMLEQDILTSLLTAFGKFSDGWEPQRKIEKGQVLLDAESDIFVQITNLLWNLCESNEKAVAAVNKSGVVRIMLKCLDLAVYPSEVVVAVGQCLHALSEENEVVAEVAREQAALLRALAAAEGDSSDRLLLKLLATGILLNVMGDDSDLKTGQVVSQVSRALTPDARELACKVTSNAEAEDYELQLTDLSLLLTAQQVALEILTDLCSGDDSSDGWADQEDSEEPDEDAEEDDCDPMEDSQWRDDPYGAALSTELQEAMAGEGLLKKIVAKAACPPANVTDILASSPSGQTICRRFETLRCRVFLCLNNLVSALELSELGGPGELTQLWHQIGQLVFTDGNECSGEVLESAAAAMRAALQKLLDAGQPGPSELSAADLQPMAARLAACKDAAARAGLLRGVALLGCLRVRGQERLGPADTELVQGVGQLLLELAAADPELQVVAEALDALMDLFGEDCTDGAAAHIQLVGRLRTMQPGIKAKMSLQRRRLGQHYPLVATVRTNLPRFIKYKSARCAAVSNGH